LAPVFFFKAAVTHLATIPATIPAAILHPSLDIKPPPSTPPLSVSYIGFSATLNMDAYSMSVTSPARRKTSKIYQDLKVTRAHSGSSRTMSIMDRVLKVFGTRPRHSSRVVLYHPLCSTREYSDMMHVAEPDGERKPGE
jgi:hypothetical protein